ncbi:preprotein translocase subunit SecY [archaeon]|nr:MAG: preprotein translocase subunit SecY [archaeon]
MFGRLRDIFKIPDLRNRILFTLALLAVYRLGGHIPLPGVDTKALLSFFAGARGTILGLYDIFVGGNLANGTIFGLGIMPYISASIILQLLGAAVPYFQRLMKEGEEGRRKITQYTRYLTVAISTLQGFGIAVMLENLRTPTGVVVVNPGLRFKFLTVLTLVAGTIFIMWLGELITERGIGNGISLIIMVGIVARFPNYFIRTLQMVRVGLSPVAVFMVLVTFFLLTLALVWVTQAQRRIPVQYAQRVVGRRIYGGRSTHIPLTMNTAGVIPIIFAQSALMLPATMARFFSANPIAQEVVNIFNPQSWIYNLFYTGLIVFFAYFYTAIVINPQDLADNLKRYGGFIPGVRPGEKTAQYIDHILTRITLPGALFFAFAAIAPTYVTAKLNVPFYFGGTSLIIVVGVALDTLRQIEAHLVMRHYEGFLHRGRIRGRRG